MPFFPVAKVAAIPLDSVREYFIDNTPYAICNVAGTIRALSGVCPHSGGPLGQGQIHEGRVVCPYHMWEFDCATGEFDYNPAVHVATYPVKTDGDSIWIEVP